MKFTPYDIEKIGYTGYKKTKLFKLLDEFVASGHECVKIDDYHHRDAHSCAGAIRVATKRFGFNGIVVVARGRDVFLINKNIASRMAFNG